MRRLRSPLFIWGDRRGESGRRESPPPPPKGGWGRGTLAKLFPLVLHFEVEPRELKQVQVKTCPNASSVLLRVFLELSVDAYLERYDLVKNNAITACSSKENLNGKVCKVLNHMNHLGTMSNDLSKGIRAEINDKNSVLSIESLNAYVHNEFFYPKADNLITGWDNIEKFFIQLWNSIDKE